MALAEAALQGREDPLSRRLPHTAGKLLLAVGSELSGGSGPGTSVPLFLSEPVQRLLTRPQRMMAGFQEGAP